MKSIFKDFTLFLALVIILISSNAFSQSDLKERILSLPSVVSVNNIDPGSDFNEAFEIFIEQPVDQKNPDGERFTQKLYLSHRNESLPMVIEMDGYNVTYNRPGELEEILNCNRIIVEHRYFGESKPESMEWKHLTIENAAADHHNIINAFKIIYKQAWIGTGISKGGQAAIFHRYFYPEDVLVTVPYVAPLNIAEEDPRIYHFLRNVGSEECRENIVQFQREILTRADSLMPLFRKRSEKHGYTYSIGNERMIFEYIVLEYSFAFWQWGKENCSDIPSTDVTNKELLKHLETNSSFSYFSDQGLEPIAPFFYQAYTEMGYYGYDISNFKDLLKEVKEPTSKIFLPKDSNLIFDCAVMIDINKWIQKHGNNMLFIYGGNDTWTGTAVQLTGETNAIKMVKSGGSHRTRIMSFDKREKEIIYSTLEEWLGIELIRE
jgi:hypothetical protein